MSNSVRPHRWQPTRLPHPWDSPGKNTGVGCHFLLQCMTAKIESEVAQPWPTLSDPMDCSLPGSSIHGIFQAGVLEWGAIRMAQINKTDKNKWWQNVKNWELEQIQPLCNTVWQFLKMLTLELPDDPTISLFSYLSKRNKNICLCKAYILVVLKSPQHQSI